MNVIESSTDVSLANLTPEFKKPADSTEAAGDSKVNKLIVSDKDNSASTAIRDSDKTKEAKEAKEAPLTPQQLEKVAQQLQDFVGEMNRGLEFSVDKDSGRDVIKVIENGTIQIIRE